MEDPEPRETELREATEIMEIDPTRRRADRRGTCQV
jgi:hypothetical protein